MQIVQLVLLEESFRTLYVEVYLLLWYAGNAPATSFRTLYVEVYLELKIKLYKPLSCFRTLYVEVYQAPASPRR